MNNIEISTAIQLLLDVAGQLQELTQKHESVDSVIDLESCATDVEDAFKILKEEYKAAIKEFSPAQRFYYEENT